MVGNLRDLDVAFRVQRDIQMSLTKEDRDKLIRFCAWLRTSLDQLTDATTRMPELTTEERADLLRVASQYLE